MNKLAVRILMLAAVVVGSATATHAVAFTFGTPGASGGCVGAGTATASGNSGETVNAAATIVLNPPAGIILVTLINCLPNPTDVGQLISDVFFTVAGATGGTFGVQTGTDICVGVSPCTTDSNTWGLDSGGPGFHLNDLGHAGPAELIIGPGPYTNANGSINGNGPHNPFLDQTGAFTITGVTGLTTSSTVTAVDISFGTQASTPPGTTTPEPGTLLLFGSGLLGIAGIVRKRLSRAVYLKS